MNVTRSFSYPVIKALNGTFEDGFLKGMWALMIAFAAEVFGRPESYLWLVAICLADTVIGLIKMWKLGEQFSIAKFRGALLKLLYYTVIVALFHRLNDISPVLATISLDELAISYFAVTEALSILKSIQQMTGKVLPEWIMSKLKKVSGGEPEPLDKSL